MERAITLLCLSAYQAYKLSLTNTAMASRAFDFSRQVVPGAMVMETSTIWRREYDAIRVGTLESIAEEPIPGDWEGEEPPNETVHYIRALSDGDLKRWTNASFIRIHDSEDQLRN